MDSCLWFLFYGVVFTAFGTGVALSSLVELSYPWAYLIIGFILLIIGTLRLNYYLE